MNPGAFLQVLSPNSRWRKGVQQATSSDLHPRFAIGGLRINLPVISRAKARIASSSSMLCKFMVPCHPPNLHDAAHDPSAICDASRSCCLQHSQFLSYQGLIYSKPVSIVSAVISHVCSLSVRGLELLHVAAAPLLFCSCIQHSI